MTPFQLADTALFSQIARIKDKGLRELSHRVRADEAFRMAYGSKGKHHAYRGGLLVHTNEVVLIALGMSERYTGLKVDRDVLLTAAVFHDYAKIHDYVEAEDGEPTAAPYRNLIRHVAGSYAQWMICTTGIECEFAFRDDTIQAVGHCILAHHGRLEWGSPVEPQTVEAQILHFADMLSHQYGEGR